MSRTARLGALVALAWVSLASAYLRSAVELGDVWGADALQSFRGWACGPVTPAPIIAHFPRIHKTGSTTLRSLVGSAKTISYVRSLYYSSIGSLRSDASRATGATVLALQAALVDAAAEATAARRGIAPRESLASALGPPALVVDALRAALSGQAWRPSGVTGVRGADGRRLPVWTVAARFLWTSHALAVLHPTPALRADGREGAPPLAKEAGSLPRAPLAKEAGSLPRAPLAAAQGLLRDVAASSVPERVVFDQHGPAFNWTAVLAAAVARGGPEAAAVRAHFTAAAVAAARGDPLPMRDPDALVVPATVYSVRHPIEREQSHFNFAVRKSALSHFRVERRAADACGCANETFDSCVGGARASGCWGNLLIQAQLTQVCGTYVECLAEQLGDGITFASTSPPQRVPHSLPSVAFVGHQARVQLARYQRALANLQLATAVGLLEEVALSTALFASRLPDFYTAPQGVLFGSARNRSTLQATWDALEQYVPNQFELLLQAHLRRFFWDAVVRCGVLAQHVHLVHAYHLGLAGGDGGFSATTPTHEVAAVLAGRAIAEAERDVRTAAARLQQWEHEHGRLEEAWPLQLLPEQPRDVPKWWV
jgi:hypothetical protein